MWKKLTKMLPLAFHESLKLPFGISLFFIKRNKGIAANKTLNSSKPIKTYKQKLRGQGRHRLDNFFFQIQDVLW